MMGIFNKIGTIVAGTSFEAIIFQAGYVRLEVKWFYKGKTERGWFMSHSLKQGTLWHYLAWWVTQIFHRDWGQQEEIRNILENGEVRNCIKEYSCCQKKCLEWELGKTAQFWVQYAVAVDSLHTMRFAIAKNDFKLRLLLWKVWLPFMFMMNKVHSSRYGA